MLDSVQEYFPGWSGEVVLATLVCLVLSLFLYRYRSDIPMAQGSVPLLGHALAYKDDPATFLSSQPEPIFRINLAGREMIVIGKDARAMKQVATMPEKNMSARQAVADIGFEYTLGLLNVHKGTDWHKRILKDYVYNNNKVNSKSIIFDVLVSAFDKETTNVLLVEDLFTLVRRTMLRAMLTYMIAPSILNGNNERFLDDFMEYQDNVEDATAKAAVLPRCIAVPLVLQPVRKRRQELTRQLADMIEDTWSNTQQIGPWLTAFQDDDICSAEAATLTMGLMFAAHKNPAIGASQCFCFLQTEATPQQQAAAINEAKSMYKSKGKQPQSCESLRRCVLETLRLTAHSIGAVRTAQNDFVLEASSGQTYSIQKGDVIAFAHITTHRDPTIWGPDASEYRQDRWASQVTVDEYKYTTFSHGVHKCPGEVLALDMMEMMLAILLARNAKLVDKNLPKVSFERATLAQREDKVPITISCNN